DAGARLLGVVQVGGGVGEARAEMQQGRGRLVLHAVVAVGRARADALEQAEHAAHALDAIERADEMHLRRAGIGEADLDAALHQGPNQTLRTVHTVLPIEFEPHPMRSLDGRPWLRFAARVVVHNQAVTCYSSCKWNDPSSSLRRPRRPPRPGPRPATTRRPSGRRSIACTARPATFMSSSISRRATDFS